MNQPLPRATDMHTVNRRNEDIPSLEPFSAITWSSTSISPEPNMAGPFAMLRINSDANDPAYNPVPGSPTSVYSFDSFIEKSYISKPQSLEIDVPDTAEPHPRSYFSPDSAEFNERWDDFDAKHAAEKSYNPFSSRNGSETSLGTGRSISPSIRATAERVTFTRVRAVRRSMRLSIASQLSATFVPPHGDTSSGEKRAFHRPAVWRPYKAMLKLLHGGNSYIAMDEPQNSASMAEPTMDAIGSPDPELKGPPIISPLPFDHGQYLFSKEKRGACLAGSHKFRRSQSTPALKRRPANLVSRCPDTDTESEAEDMDGMHDLTVEALGITAFLSAKWKFEPLRQDQDAHKRRASLP